MFLPTLAPSHPSGVTITDLKDADVTASELKGAAFSLEEIKGADYKVDALLDSHTAEELKAAGGTISLNARPDAARTTPPLPIAPRHPPGRVQGGRH